MKKGQEKVLIIKAGYSEFLEEERNTRKPSLGDVLRTTPILHLYKNDRVTWVTDEKALPLLTNNKYIDRLLYFDWITSEQLQSEEFDKVINLEKVPGICALSDKIHARKARYGFTFNSQTGKPEAYERAFDVLVVSYNSKAKKENKKVYQELLFEIVGEKWNGEEYILGYKPKSKEKYDVGLNTEIGEKWPTKAWSKSNWDILEKKLHEEGYSVTRQDKQKEYPNILQNLNEYIEWINLCKLIVSNDSLGLHLGITLKKKVLGLFGATPHKEIYFYNRGKAILPLPIPECLPCFKGTCRRKRNCIEDISPEKVYKEIKKYANN